MRRGQITITAIAGTIGLLSVVAAPVVYVANIKENVAVLKTKQENIEKSVGNLEKNMAEVGTNVASVKASVDALTRVWNVKVTEPDSLTKKNESPN